MSSNAENQIIDENFSSIEKHPDSFQNIEYIESLEKKEKNIPDEIKSELNPTFLCVSETTNIETNENAQMHKRANSQPVFGETQTIMSFTKSLRSGFNTIHDTALKGTQHVVETATWMAQSVARYSRKLINHCELPDWLKDNIYIHKFHRPELHTFKKCFKSIFSIHTETGNIWTHLLGLFVMIAAACYIYILPHATKDGSPFYPTNWQQILSFAAFFFGACFCMTFSWLFHTLSCHSEKVHAVFVKLDYSGISFLIAGSMMPVMYYGFFCEPKTRLIYIVVILCLSLTCIIVSLWNLMSTPKFRVLRGVIFLSFGLSSIVPMIHMFIIYKSDFAIKVMSLYWLIVMGAFYVIGCVLYMFLVPERFFPGKINLIFQSHQIFHVCVVIAAILHLHAMCLMADFRNSLGYDCRYNNSVYRYQY